MKNTLNQLLAGRDLTFEQSHEIMDRMMQGEFSDPQIAGFLMALQSKGPVAAEIAGFAEAMRSKMVPVPITVEAIDMCGTGGDGSGTFNISTAASLVVAGAGVPVAKHGNRSISSRSGSADVLAALGVDVALPPDKMAQAVDEVGIGFLFAPALHPAMKHVMPARTALGVRTVFNILGPLCNPAGVKRQVIGVYDADLAAPMAGVLQQLGSEHAMVVHGADGMDELTTTGATTMVSFSGKGSLETSEITPDEVGLPKATAADLAGGTPEENGAIMLKILEGETGPRRDIVALNAAAGLLVAGRAADLQEGLALAEESLDSGRARQVLKELAAFK